MRWLDNNSFPVMRQLLGDQGGEDLAVLRSVPTRDALGVFRAVSTRDGEAQARDGQRFFSVRTLESQADEAIVETHFADGVWMLAVPDDLEIVALGPGEWSTSPARLCRSHRQIGLPFIGWAQCPCACSGP